MKAFATARWDMGVQSVYLLDDRIEVGSIDSMYFEELRRVAYRDVLAVSTWRSRRPFRIVVGWLLVAAAVFVGIVAISSMNHPTWIVEPILISLGVASMWWGRDGSVLRFRVEGPHGMVQGAIVGSATKQDRFVVELMRKIEERRGAGSK